MTVATADGVALGGLTRLVVTQPSCLAAARAAMDAVLVEVDATYSRFREDSELSRVNTHPDQEHRISPLLATAVAAGLRGARVSGGAVDPTLGRLMRVTGYDRTFTEIESSGPALRLTVRSVAGWKGVLFDGSRRALRIPRGIELDLGATGKGLAADLAAAAAYEAAGAGSGVLVSLGGDIATAGEPPAGGWVIQVGEDSSAPISNREESVTITSGALATSSTTVRRWKRGEVEIHHILDPRTGLPADGPWRTATVVASSCLDANIASTGAIVKGIEAGAWLDALGLPARLVDRDGGIIRVAGWPEWAAR
jgi:thiamine biosynthesis lipoprotein